MNVWIVGARPRTLPASVVPVAVGTAVALSSGHVVAWRAAAALVVALALQVGVNYANDYSDGVRGADVDRVGPVRLVASGLASPARVKGAAMVAFAVAGCAGLALALAVDARLVAVGALCIAGAWFYTGGRHPYGYAGLGEVAVFTFFGLVATIGSAYVHLHRVTVVAVVAAVPVGLLATAILVANNLRDIPTDAAAGKRTLAVRLGDGGTRLLYGGCLIGSFGCVVILAVARPLALLTLLALPLAVGPLRAVQRGASGRDLVAVLVATARLELVAGLLLAAGLAI